MKKFILASMIACAAAFTACGDDDSGTSAGGSGSGGSKASCDVYMGGSGDMSGHLCFEYGNSQIVDQQCASQNATYSALGGSATVGSGCPSGAKLECSQDGGKIYIYGVMAYGESCETFTMKE